MVTVRSIEPQERTTPAWEAFLKGPHQRLWQLDNEFRRPTVCHDVDRTPFRSPPTLLPPLSIRVPQCGQTQPPNGNLNSERRRADIGVMQFEQCTLPGPRRTAITTMTAKPTTGIK